MNDFENKREIPLSVPNLNHNIVENLKECIETGWVSTGGHFISDFENAVAEYINVTEAVACQSGTAGLHTALRILGVGAGDEVIVPALTFIAAINPVKYLGAEPVFMDCDDFFCMDADKLRRFFEIECEKKEQSLYNKKTGKRIAAIVAVHVFGNITDMKKVMELAEEYNVKVLEDATEALGSYYTDGEYTGKYAGTIGDMGVYSFNANKIITTGGGGMIVAKCKEDIDMARYLTTTAKDDGLYFAHDEVGYNYRMLNIQAAIGVSQMAELESFIERKTENYKRYTKNISGVSGLNLLPYSPSIRANHWFYAFEIDEARLGISRNALMNELIKRGIQCRPVWKLCNEQKSYTNAEAYEITKATHYEKTVLNLPCSSNLNPEDVDYVCDVLLQIVNEEK